MPEIRIIGGGLSGCEAALQLADDGWQVELCEMRPAVRTPAHQTDLLAELVCSNSFKSQLPETAAGLLKAELKLMGCRLLSIAENFMIPAGNALAVDRDLFAGAVTKAVQEHPNIDLLTEEVTRLSDTKQILATGPLTSPGLTSALQQILGDEYLFFFDAIAPIVSADELDMDIVFARSRYDKGEADYLNCPFSKEEYLNFVEALQKAEKRQVREFEDEFFQQLDFHFYENCTPIEELVRRGPDTLRFGVMRPVGLEDPRTGKRPYAVIQLRPENRDGTAYNLVGCQTMLRYGEQQRVFRLIPGLREARFLRFGSLHRNTYLNSPRLLNPDFSLQLRPNIYVAGVLGGVEGYMESIASGLLVARVIARGWRQLPDCTICGQLWQHLLRPVANFQPVNANFGLLPALTVVEKAKKLKKARLAARALQDLSAFLSRPER